MRSSRLSFSFLGKAAIVAAIAAGTVTFLLTRGPLGDASAARQPVCPRFEVRLSEFGPVGNNADITAPLLAAMNCLAKPSGDGLSYGGTVIIDGGRSIVGCDIAIPNAVTLRGEGRQQTALVLRNGASCQRGVIVNAHPSGQHTARVRDLAIYGGPGTTPALLSFECVFDGSLISDVNLYNSTGDGIQMGCATQPPDANGGPNSGPTAIERVEIANVKGHGIHLRGSAFHYAIRESSVVVAGGAGVYLEGPAGLGIERASPMWGIRIADMHFEATRWGVWIQNSAAITLDNIGIGNEAGVEALLRITGNRGQGAWGSDGIDARGLVGRASFPLVLDETRGTTVQGTFLAQWAQK